MADAGWYPDAQDPNAQHYFDGENWTGQRRPNPDAAGEAAQSQQWSQPPAAEGETVRRGDLPGWQGGAPEHGPHPSGYGQYPAEQTPAWQQQPTEQTPAWQQQPTEQTPAWQQQPAEQAPAWQQQPTEQSPAWQQQPGPSGGWAPQGAPGQWDQPHPTPARTRKRKPLIIAGVAVLAVAAGLTTWLVWPDDEPSITYNGKEIASANDTLSKAENALKDAVDKRHGVENDQTRCYFAKPKDQPSGAKQSDVEKALRCGPVLFVDGEKSAAYMRVSLNESDSGEKVSLEAPEDVSSIQPAALGNDVELIRPDGKTAPDGDGGLSVPKPPPAAKDSVTAATLGPTAAPKSLSDAVMVGKYTKVTVTRAAEIQRYGIGDDARSAPTGQKLIAFQLTYGSGDVTSASSSDAVDAQLVVDGGTPKDLPDAPDDSYIVAAVPSSGTAQILLDDGGFKQTLSLPDGKPGSDNIAVLRRSGRSGVIGKTVTVPIALSRGSSRGSVKFPTTATIASLDFWAPGDTSVHASSPKNAILSVKINYRFEGDTYAYPANMLRIKLAGGKYAKARDLAAGNKIYNVFEVPATFTRGSLQILGSTKVGSIRVKVKSTKSFTVSIPKS